MPSSTLFSFVFLGKCAPLCALLANNFERVSLRPLSVTCCALGRRELVALRDLRVVRHLPPGTGTWDPSWNADLCIQIVSRSILFFSSSGLQNRNVLQSLISVDAGIMASPFRTVAKKKCGQLATLPSPRLAPHIAKYSAQWSLAKRME